MESRTAVTAPVDSLSLYPAFDVALVTPTSIMDEPGSATYKEKPWPTAQDPPPPPNPPFVFPARSSAPSFAFPPPPQRRPASISGIQNTPSANERRSGQAQSPIKWTFPRMDQPTGLNSPPQSPPQPNARPLAHRRAESSVARDGTPTSPTSPTASIAPLDGPASLAPPPPRRGRHAHRRSGALSCQDLSLIMKPGDLTSGKSGSAPTSPLDSEQGRAVPPLRATMSQVLQPSPAEFDVPEVDITRKSRVGFAEQVEVIPRPLSLMSSDTSSTVTVLRHNHSVSGSISSLNSARLPTSPQPELYTNANSSRPSTAGAVLSGDNQNDSRSWFGNWLQVSTSSKRPTSASASPTPGSPVAQSFNSWKSVLSTKRDSDPKSDGSSTGKTTQPASPTTTSPTHLCSPPLSPVKTKEVEETETPRERSPTTAKKDSKKHKRVKLWAGSILSKKSKSKHRVQRQRSGSKRSPTPPLRNSAVFADAALASLNLESIKTPGEAEPEPEPQSKSKPEPLPSLTIAPVSPPSSDLFSPIIDLDAALGPFNTPDLGDARGGGFNVAKRRMHSGGRTGGFSGPGLHYHRRTESAPEMVGFEGFGEFGLHRLGSRSTMADVFEEEEEEEEKDEENESEEGRTKGEKKMEPTGLGLDVPEGSNSPDSETTPTQEAPADTIASHRGLKRKGSATSDEGSYNRYNLMQKISTQSLRDEVIPEEAPFVFEADTDSRPWTSTSSNLPTPALSASQYTSVTPKLGLPMPSPQFWSPEDRSSTSGSAFPSPDFPSYFEDTRVYTATSSFVEDPNFEAMLLSGEPGPEYRVSVDDVPSLTSSHSTMTSGINTQFPQLPLGSEERTLSMSSAPAGPPRTSLNKKRSSLASFTRLIGSSHGERSKLSIENRPIEETETSPQKEKRWSRMKRLLKVN